MNFLKVGKETLKTSQTDHSHDNHTNFFFDHMKTSAKADVFSCSKQFDPFANSVHFINSGINIVILNLINETEKDPDIILISLF